MVCCLLLLYISAAGGSERERRGRGGGQQSPPSILLCRTILSVQSNRAGTGAYHVSLYRSGSLRVTCCGKRSSSMPARVWTALPSSNLPGAHSNTT